MSLSQHKGKPQKINTKILGTGKKTLAIGRSVGNV